MSASDYSTKNPKIARLFAQETEMYNLRDYIRKPFKEMIVVYLIIVFEEFLSNLLSALFSKRHEILKKSEKQISFKDAVDYSDIKDLVKDMSEKEAKGLVDQDIEDLGKKLGERFHLYLYKNDDWGKFKEFFYRRHIIVHNYGAPDAKYIEKTNRTEFEVKGKKNESLEISDTYINEAFSIFENYANEIKNFFHKKFVQDKSDKTKSRPN